MADVWNDFVKENVSKNFHSVQPNKTLILNHFLLFLLLAGFAYVTFKERKNLPQELCFSKEGTCVRAV